jgi:hypothetical protein
MVRQLTQIIDRQSNIAEANMHFPQKAQHIETLDKNYNAIKQIKKNLSRSIIQTVR